jgi:hypothetical protein
MFCSKRNRILGFAAGTVLTATSTVLSFFSQRAAERNREIESFRNFPSAGLLAAPAV